MVEDQYSPDTAYLLEFTLDWVCWAFICSVRMGQDRDAGANGGIPSLQPPLPVAREEGLGQQKRGKSLAAVVQRDHSF